MKNSFTIWELYVSLALVNISKVGHLIFYMDDPIMAHLVEVYLQRTVQKELKAIGSLHLILVSDKIQMVPPLPY